MTPDPIIVSIPHTGTRFLKARLGIEDHIHTNKSWSEIIDKVEGRHIITPLRMPPQVWRSWCRRNDQQNLRVWMPQFFIAYGMLHALTQVRDVDFICIEKQEDERVKDWRPVGSVDSEHAHWKLHDIDLRIIYKIPFVIEHYGHTG